MTLSWRSCDCHVTYTSKVHLQMALRQPLGRSPPLVIPGHPWPPLISRPGTKILWQPIRPHVASFPPGALVAFNQLGRGQSHFALNPDSYHAPVPPTSSVFHAPPKIQLAILNINTPLPYIYCVCCLSPSFGFVYLSFILRSSDSLI